MANQGVNEFVVDGVFPLTAETTTVTGRVTKGAFRKGETVSLMSALGIPLLAPIAQLGSGETPVNVVREGQKTTLVLKVESHHVSTGARLTSTGDDEAYGATMIADTSSGGGDAAVVSPELTEAERLLNARQFEGAKTTLDGVLAVNPNDAVANRLMARVYLEAEHELNDSKAALEHIKKAYEAGGAEDPLVLETLAQAFGVNGEVEQGLRFLERLYDMADDMDAKKRYAERITAYRKRHKVADQWSFIDGFGDVVFESRDMGEIVKAIQNGSIPEGAKCRKNKVGSVGTIEEVLVPESPEVAALYKKGAGNTFLMFTGSGALVGALVGTTICVLGGMPWPIGAMGGLLLGTGIGTAMGKGK